MTESAATENYLKVLWTAGEWSDAPVTVSVLASRLGLAPSSVSEVVRRLTDRGLVAHARYGTIELTPDGRRIALGTVRKHRLIETFLVDYLGYTWDEVHDEADLLEHAVSDTFVDRLALRLGEPDRDPHGDPIPHADGSMPGGDELTFDAVAEGAGCGWCGSRLRSADPAPPRPPGSRWAACWRSSSGTRARARSTSCTGAAPSCSECPQPGPSASRRPADGGRPLMDGLRWTARDRPRLSPHRNIHFDGPGPDPRVTCMTRSRDHRGRP
ncbi:metal-dependent transcriptional regulator [Pseudonocardia benzenivorans]